MLVRHTRVTDHDPCPAVREALNRLGDKWSVLAIVFAQRRAGALQRAAARDRRHLAADSNPHAA